MPKNLDVIALAKQKFSRWVESAAKLQATKNELTELAELNERDNLLTAIDVTREEIGGRLSKWGNF